MMRERQNGSDGSLIFRAGRLVPWMVLSAVAALMLVGLYLATLNRGADVPKDTRILVTLFIDLVLLGFAALGLLVVSRRPGNPVGWIITGVSLLASISGFAQSYAIYAIYTDPGGLPGGEAMALLSTLTFIPVLFAAPAMLFLLFPDGKLMSRRWWPVFWLVILTTCSTMAGSALNPVMNDAPFKGVNNPLGLDAPRALYETFANFGWPGMTVSLVLAAVAMILRLRRSRGMERQQLKWIAAAAAILPLPSAAGVFAYYLGYETLGGIFSTFAFVPIIFAAGYAVLRYRLYDIDFIINRVLVYGVLSVSLVIVYLGGVVSLQYVFRTLAGGGSQLAIVVSTLTIAALFNPLRRSIQTAIDRRFYRSKYDAQRVLAEFSPSLRDETGLEPLISEMLAVVRGTVQPSSVSVWLRGPDDESGEAKG